MWLEQDRVRVVVLSGPRLPSLSTAATLIRAGVHVVGICVCNQTRCRIPLKNIWISAHRKGISVVLGQTLGRVYYALFNGRKDARLFHRLFDVHDIHSVLKNWQACGGELHYTRDYGAPDTIAWFKSKAIDIFVAHTPYWIGREVREIPKNLTIGGHPGLTPHYRGSHSAFWALYNGRPQEVGWSIFWLDGGVDTGDLIAQGTIPIEEDDSYFSLAWKAVKKQAEEQARVILDYENGVAIPRQPHGQIPPGSEYAVPTLTDYLEYRKRQAKVR